ncbi:ribose-5-phosphate isomerase RpiA [Parvibaculum sp.]|jgi:ribose 5-phosphate isomerase A|uniref:ribose-5-phosphate isomerase RpiA n=1 Tax=Parvibaculum sp. TaxID=2024848 RepID=UPI001B0F3C17|nr:ribose-5-phosphate isomerase RpiA [Parvibaculum sp.]MBO6635302.1 ribose-5-phosphate isomerase RpiA [Parvibaculum sp.]MBO6678784.1 ribose-5-phosphate isomerase RpiA [Parvibaculum sp.]MBO6684864.1 ribose-5-phosphate isomerase RpiA [Parvibaculum sp.]MBO6903930.1 ribose-5-phosphate isomerase RpiA [Parvibaculum sp.]
MNADDQKKAAAVRALDYVKPGMKLGLGTGSTAEHFVRALGEKVKQGLDVLCVPTSERTGKLAESLGIPLTNLDDTPHLDITVDGADELDRELRLIKGGGGALLREKIVATASERMIVIADASKLVETLGAFPLPVEVIPFGAAATARRIAEVASDFGCTGRMSRRADEYGEPFFTDSENFIYDCAFGTIPDPDGLSAALNRIAGVVDNGLFIGIASLAIVGTATGTDILGSI